ncbi:MAG TPA: double zinc ribbon domain-containing protein [Planctomycetota bacterium]
MHSRWRHWHRLARELGRALLDLALPPACPACGTSSDGLCDGCQQNLHNRPDPGCARCGEAVLAAGESCGGEHRELQLVARLTAPFRFVGTGGALVRRFKLDANAAAGAFLLRAMAASWRAASCAGWHRALLVPVPLHGSRRRERGFDQAEWLARGLARRLGLEVMPGVLARRRATLPQGDPRVLSRPRNVEGAFAVVRPGSVAGRRVVLVDDVFTSGATARSCAALLRGAGALEVAMLAACRS